MGLTREVTEVIILDSTVPLPPKQVCTETWAAGDIWGTRKEINGDAGKPLTDARETSYVI